MIERGKRVVVCREGGTGYRQPPVPRAARLTALFLVVGGVAFAQPLPVTLMWQAPDGCPQYDDVWARLSERLGRTPSTPRERSIAARGAMMQEDGVYKLELQTLTPAGIGQRVFTNASCEELTRLAVVALSVAIDPMMEPPPEVAPRKVWLGVGPRMTYGVLPTITAGLMGSVALDVRPATFELSLETALAQTATIDGTRSLTVGLPIGGGLSACLGYFGSRVTAQGCANVRAALLTGTPMGVAVAIAGLGGYLGAGPRVQARVLLHDLVSLRLSLDGNVTLVAPQFQFANGTSVQAQGFSFVGTLAVDFKLW